MVLGPFAFIKGWLISVTLWVGTLCTVLVAQELASSAPYETGENYALGLAVTVLWWGFGIALVVAAPLGRVLGLLLRPVQNQWLHVAAFFAAPTTIFWILGGLLGFGWTIEALGFWATTGVAAAAGRFSVRKHLD